MHSDFSRAGAVRGQKQNIRNGYRAGGRAPFGYRLVKHPIGLNSKKQEIHKTTLEPDLETFHVANEYLQRRAMGESRRSIMHDFMDRGVKSPGGTKTWYSSAGKAIEENHLVYQGHLVYNRHNERIDKKRYKGGQKWRDPSEWVIHEHAHERCIDDNTASKIAIQLRKNKEARTSPGPRRYLLTDVLFCGDCGGRMVGNSGFYACMNKMRKPDTCHNSNIKAEMLDKEVLKYLKEKLITENFYEQFVQKIQGQYQTYKTESLREEKHHLKRIGEIGKEIERLMTLFSRGKIKAEIIEAAIEPLQKEKGGLEGRAKDLSEMEKVLDIKIGEFSSERIRAELQRFEELANDDNIIEMRNMVRDFIYQIKLFPKEQPTAKKWQRCVEIQSFIRTLTMTKVASPTGFEPVLPA
jgi:site-specific DNA recombinase